MSKNKFNLLAILTVVTIFSVNIQIVNAQSFYCNLVSNWFSSGFCNAENAKINNNNSESGVYNPGLTQTNSFSGFFSNFFGANNKSDNNSLEENNQKANTANENNVFNPNDIKSSDFLGSKIKSGDSSSNIVKKLLTDAKVKSQRDVFEKCQKDPSLQECKSKDRLAKEREGQNRNGEGLDNYNPNKGDFWSQNGGGSISEGEHYHEEPVYTREQIAKIDYSRTQAGLDKNSISGVDYGAESSGCSGNGVINKAGNFSILNSVKFDTSRLCTAFGKKITVVDAKRGCNGPSRHCFGEAVDFEINSYGDRKQQALLIVMLISLGYNIGSYEPNFPLHADKEKSSYWKTWSRWAHKNNRDPLPYQQPVVDALSLIGMPAKSSAEFRSKYGKPSKSSMIEKAKEAIKSTGNAKLINIISSGESALSS